MTLLHLAHATYHTLRICIPTVIQSALGTLTTPICDERLDSWSRAIVRFAEIDISVEGFEHAVSQESYVVMSNHQSHYDIPVLFQALRPRRLRMVAKSELFRLPIWTGAMRAAGFVEVNRQNRVLAMKSLDRAREAIAAGTSIWIAPEGTRSPDGVLGTFKKGGFHLASGAGARILPVSIDGTRRILPARGRHVQNGEHVSVVVHEPVAPGARDDEKQVMALVRERILSGLPRAD